MEAFKGVDGGTLHAIQQLQSVLDKNYLSAEKIMSLRNPDHETLKALLNDIDTNYRELIGAMASSNVGSEAIVAVTQNQHEFKCRSNDWFSKQDQSTSGITTAISGDKEPPKSTGHLSTASHHSSKLSSKISTKSSRGSSKSSRSSSRLSLKQMEVEAKLKLAQLESKHLKERAEEKERQFRLETEEKERQFRLKTEEKERQIRLNKEIEDREAERKIALAQVEFEIYGRSDLNQKLENDDVTDQLSNDSEQRKGENNVLKPPSQQTNPVTERLPVSNLFLFDENNIDPLFGSTNTVSCHPPESVLSSSTVCHSRPAYDQKSTSNLCDLALGHTPNITISQYPATSSLVAGTMWGPPPTSSSVVAGTIWGPPPTSSHLAAGASQGLPSAPSSFAAGPTWVSLLSSSSVPAIPVWTPPQAARPVQSLYLTTKSQIFSSVRSTSSYNFVPNLVSEQATITASNCSTSSAAPNANTNRISSFHSFVSSGQPPQTTWASSSWATNNISHSFNPSRQYGYSIKPQVYPDRPTTSFSVCGPFSSTSNAPVHHVPYNSYVPPADKVMSSDLTPICYPGVYTPHALHYDNLFLPRPEFPKFSGDPLEYKPFIQNFETHIEPRVRDEKALFCLLLQHCTKTAKDHIEHFATNEFQPYTKAKQRLTKEYGSPWVISDVCEQRLKKFPVIKSGDGKQLKCFAEMLEKINVTVKDIRQYSSLDSLDTLTDLIGKLPYNLKRRWVKRSVQVQSLSGRLANFSHFVEFVLKESEEVNSIFGLRSLGPKSSHSKTPFLKAKPSEVKSASFGIASSKSKSNTQSKPIHQPGSCWFCKDSSHMLYDCKVFKEKSVRERTKFVKDSKLCHKCLSSKHRTPECKRRNTCFVPGCKGSFHHTLLHRTPSEEEGEVEKRDVSSSESVLESKTTKCHFTKQDSSNDSNSQVYLCVVPVKVTYGNKTLCTYAFLDQGSTNSFIEKSLIQQLGIEGHKENLELKTITGVAHNYESMSCDITVSNLDDDVSFSLSNVFSIENIPVKPNDLSVTVDEKMRSSPHLHDVQLNSLSHSSVGLLIGADVPELFCIYSARKGPPGAPCAIETPLGWSLLGPSLSPSRENNCKVNFITMRDKNVDNLVTKMWEAEFDAGTSIFEGPCSKEDRIAHSLMQSSILVTKGHYQLPLLWKEAYMKQLPNNLVLAQRRLACLKKRLSKDSELHAKYTEVMNTYFANGHACKVSKPNSIDHKSPIWYLPHHPVTNINKPGKVRVVFDCAAKYKGMSLNDALMKGPHLLNNLTGVLIRFRKNRIALVVDIEAMFHQVKVDPLHVNALRFLWWENGCMDKEPLVCQMLVHLFGATSSPSCANFSLRQTAIELGHRYKPIITSVIKHNFYVDDCLVSLSSVEETIYVYKHLTELLAQRGFRLTKWLTNHEGVLNQIPDSERSAKAKQYLLGTPTDDRVLGVQWQVNEDQFTFEVKVPTKPCTRRGILSTVASIYDPLGFVAPILLEAKRILQLLCKQTLGWDEPIGEVECNRWKVGLILLSF